MSNRKTRDFYIRAAPKSSKARNDRVYHNADCPKLSQRNLEANAYERVAQPPDGSRPCRGCGG